LGDEEWYCQDKKDWIDRLRSNPLPFPRVIVMAVYIEEMLMNGDQKTCRDGQNEYDAKRICPRFFVRCVLRHHYQPETITLP